MENIIKLQKSYDLTIELKKRMNHLKAYPKVVDLKANMDHVRKSEASIKNKLDNFRDNLVIQENELKNQEIMLIEIGEKLYSGKINDIEVLQNLKEKEETLNSQKELIENEVIDIMGKIDIYTRELNKMKHRYNLLEEKLDKLEMQIEEKLNEYDKALINHEKKIQYLRSIINDIILKKYDEVRKKHNNAIVKVENEICGGCNLQIFLGTINLIEKKEIAECENCGRLLYLE